MEGLIFGEMLAEAVPCSVLQDRIAQRTHKKYLVLAGLNFHPILQPMFMYTLITFLDLYTVVMFFCFHLSDRAGNDTVYCL